MNLGGLGKTYLIEVIHRHIQFSIPATDVMFANHPKAVDAPEETAIKGGREGSVSEWKWSWYTCAT